MLMTLLFHSREFISPQVGTNFQTPNGANLSLKNAGSFQLSGC